MTLLPHNFLSQVLLWETPLVAEQMHLCHFHMPPPQPPLQGMYRNLSVNCHIEIKKVFWCFHFLGFLLDSCESGETKFQVDKDNGCSIVHIRMLALDFRLQEIVVQLFIRIHIRIYTNIYTNALHLWFSGNRSTRREIQVTAPPTNILTPSNLTRTTFKISS